MDSPFPITPDIKVDMNELEAKFFSNLFDRGDMTCLADSVYVNSCVSYLAYDKSKHCYVTINPCWPKRRKNNVTKYRTLLFEIDNSEISLDEQYRFFQSIGLPYSSIVYSGNKSLHFLVSLDHLLPDEVSYRRLFNIIARAINHPDLDKAVKSPAQFTRAPNSIRYETGKKQEIWEVRDRVKIDELVKWIELRIPRRELISKKRTKAKPLALGDSGKGVFTEKSILKLRKKDFKKLKERKVYEGERNPFWYRVGCQMKEIGFQLHETIQILNPYFNEESDFSRKEWERVIINAYNYS